MPAYDLCEATELFMEDADDGSYGKGVFCSGGASAGPTLGGFFS